MTASPVFPTARARAWIALVALATIGCVHTREVEAPAAEPTAALEQDLATPTQPSIFRDGAIEFIQVALQKEGFTLAITGKLDDATTTALLSFQKQKNLARTGLPDQETLQQLGLEPEALYSARDASK